MENGPCIHMNTTESRQNFSGQRMWGWSKCHNNLDAWCNG